MSLNESTPPQRVVPDERLKREGEILLKSLVDLKKNFSKFPSQFFNQNPVPLDLFVEKVKEIYVLVDRYFSSANELLEGSIACNSQCVNCCSHYPSSVEPFELFFIYAKIRQRSDIEQLLVKCFSRTEIFESLLAQAKESLTESEAEDLALKEYFQSQKLCPFNQDGHCSIYEIRPISCRMYFSLTPETYCTPDHIETDKNRSFIHYFSDQVELSIEDLKRDWEDWELSDSLYRGLLEMALLEEWFKTSSHLF